MDKDKIEYIYDCYIYNIFNSEYSIVWRQLSSIEGFSDSYLDDLWNRDSANMCIKEYSKNRSLMGKDIYENGMYMAFSYYEIEDREILKSGAHRFNGLINYYKENNKNSGMYIFYNVEDYYNNKSTGIYREYMIPKYNTYSFLNNDLYLNGIVNKKYYIKDLKYDMCLIRYCNIPIFPIEAVAERISPFIWSWNNDNKDNKIKARKILNDMLFFFEKKDTIKNELYKKITKEYTI